MSNCQLFHFTDAPELDLNRIYDKAKTMVNKPRGLWVSNENDYGWMQWVKDQDFSEAKNKFKFEIVLNEKHNLLFIETSQEFISFQEKYKLKQVRYLLGGIDWVPVYEKYQGIIIPRYFHEFRLSVGSEWYYPWDCASGCIWDLRTISKVVRER